jgi:hypothetical protein
MSTINTYAKCFYCIDSEETFDLLIKFYGWKDAKDFFKDVSSSFDTIKDWYFELEDPDASSGLVSEKEITQVKELKRPKSLDPDIPVFFVSANRLYGEDLRSFIDSYLKEQISDTV